MATRGRELRREQWPRLATSRPGGREEGGRSGARRTGARGAGPGGRGGSAGKAGVGWGQGARGVEAGGGDSGGRAGSALWSVCQCWSCLQRVPGLKVSTRLGGARRPRLPPRRQRRDRGRWGALQVYRARRPPRSRPLRGLPFPAPPPSSR